MSVNGAVNSQVNSGGKRRRNGGVGKRGGIGRVGRMNVSGVSHNSSGGGAGAGGKRSSLNSRIGRRFSCVLLGVGRAGARLSGKRARPPPIFHMPLRGIGGRIGVRRRDMSERDLESAAAEPKLAGGHQIAGGSDCIHNPATARPGEVTIEGENGVSFSSGAARPRSS